jgi:hypothetical protein
MFQTPAAAGRVGEIASPFRRLAFSFKPDSLNGFWLKLAGLVKVLWQFCE